MRESISEEHLAEKEQQRKLKEQEAEKMKDKPKMKRKTKKREPTSAATHNDAIRTIVQVNTFAYVVFTTRSHCFRRRI